MHSSPSVTDVARHFAEYLNRVAYRGERFTLMRGRKPVAELRPIPAGRRLGELPGLLTSLPGLSEADAASLDEDLTSARDMLSRGPVPDPWEF